MLVLGRKQGESITLTIPASETETTVEVRVLDRRSDNTRIGITAPREVAIVRCDAIQREPLKT